MTSGADDPRQDAGAYHRAPPPDDPPPLTGPPARIPWQMTPERRARALAAIEAARNALAHHTTPKDPDPCRPDS